MTERVLVTGAGGQLGVDMVRASEIAGHTVLGCDRSTLDLTDPMAASTVVSEFGPTVVINCAAYTAVDACETEIELAHEVNGHGVGRLAEACATVGAHLVHVSTDYVFDGTLDRAYREDDATNPKSVYGASKLAGERAAVDVLGDGVTIARTAWVCGEHGNNMVKLVRRLAATGNPIAFVDDQRGCPTFTADLAPALLQLANDRPGGVFHLTNSGAVSWYEFVREILIASDHDPKMVSPISSADLDPPRPAPRPANSVLDNARWSDLGYAPLRDFRAPLADLVRKL
jgi:dTDP-4-dehydrorhamnose reductase